MINSARAKNRSDPPRAKQQKRGRLRFQAAAGDGLLSCVYWISDADPERFAENRGLCRRIGMEAVQAAASRIKSHANAPLPTNPNQRTLDF